MVIIIMMIVFLMIGELNSNRILIILALIAIVYLFHIL